MREAHQRKGGKTVDRFEKCDSIASNGLKALTHGGRPWVVFVLGGDLTLLPGRQ